MRMYCILKKRKLLVLASFLGFCQLLANRYVRAFAPSGSDFCSIPPWLVVVIAIAVVGGPIIILMLIYTLKALVKTREEGSQNTEVRKEAG